MWPPESLERVSCCNVTRRLPHNNYRLRLSLLYPNSHFTSIHLKCISWQKPRIYGCRKNHTYVHTINWCRNKFTEYRNLSHTQYNPGPTNYRASLIELKNPFLFLVNFVLLSTRRFRIIIWACLGQNAKKKKKSFWILNKVVQGNPLFSFENFRGVTDLKFVKFGLLGVLKVFSDNCLHIYSLSFLLDVFPNDSNCVHSMTVPSSRSSLESPIIHFLLQDH